MAIHVRCSECGKRTEPSVARCRHCDAGQRAICLCGEILSTYAEICGGCGAVRDTPLPYRPRLLRTWVGVSLVGTLLVAVAAVVVARLRHPPSRWEVLATAADDLDQGRNEVARDRLQAALSDRGDGATAAADSENGAAARPGDARAWYLFAIACLRVGDADEARAAIERAYGLHPTLRGVATLAARCRLSAGDARGALLAAAHADDAAARIVEAHAFQALSQPAAASDALAAAIDGGLPDLLLLTEAAVLAAEVGQRAFPGAEKYRARATALAERLEISAKRAGGDDPEDAAAALALAVAGDLGAQADRGDVARRYERAASLERDGTTARAARVRFLVREGRSDEARTVVADVIALDATAAPALTDALARSGDVEGAVLALRSICEQAPGDNRARVALVRGLLALERPAEAMEAAECGETSDVDLLTAAGDAARAAGDPQRANACYDAALARRPGTPPLLLRRHDVGLAGLCRALVMDRELTDEEAVARAALERVRSADPDDPGGLSWASRVAAAQGLSRDAFVLAHRWAELSPDAPFARASAYVAACAAGGADEAELDALANLLLASDGTPADDFRIFGAAAIDNGRASIARRVTSTGATSWPEDAGLQLLRARAELLFGRARYAEMQLVRAFGAAPESTEVRELLAWCRVLDGRPDEALGGLGPPSDPRRVAARSRLLLAVARKADAEAELRAALAASPGDPILVHALGGLLIALGRPVEAIELVEPCAAVPEAEPAIVLLLSDALAAAPSDAATTRLVALRARVAAHPERAVDLLRIDARLALATGNPARARELIERFVALSPGGAGAWREVAVVRERAGDPGAAILALRRAHEIDPTDATVRSELASLLYAEATRRLGSDDHTAARLAFEAALTFAPDWAIADTALATKLYELQLPELSAAQCRRILDQQPGNVVARVVRALTLDARGYRAAALADLDALVARYPGTGAIHLQRGLLRLRSSRAAEAAADFRDAAAGGCCGADLEYGLAGCAVFAGQVDEALSHARRAVELAPAQAFPHRALGEALALAGDTDAAVAAFNRAYERAPKDALPVVAAARLLLEAGRWEAAAAELGRLGSPRGEALALLGEAELGAGRVDVALTSSLEAGPDHPRAWLRAATIQEDRGDSAAAIDSYRAALAGGITERAVRVHAAALLLDVAGAAVEAQTILDGLVAEIPNDPVALNNLAVALALGMDDPPLWIDESEAARRRRQLARPLKLAERARALAPSDPDVADSLGWLRWLVGDMPRARELLEESIRGGERAEARYHLAWVETREGHVGAARDLLRRALADAPAAPWAPKARALLASITE